MSHDSLIHRLVRPVVRRLARTAVTPNQVTWLRLATGLAAAAALAQGSDPWRHVGAALFLLSFLLDRVDGELARQTGRTSPYGHRLDLISDGAANMLAFVGLGVGLRLGAFGLWSIVMGAVAGLGVALILLTVWRLEALQGERAGELGSFGGFDADDAMLAVPLLLWLGLAESLLVLAGVGAPLFCLGLAFRFRRQLRRQLRRRAAATPRAGRSTGQAGPSARS